MYGCSISSTHSARQQGNLDTVFFTVVNGTEGEQPCIEMTTADDPSSSADEDTGYRVKHFYI